MLCNESCRERPSLLEKSATRNAAERPILFDRYYAAQLGGQAVDLLLEERTNAVSILQYDKERGFHLDGIDGNATSGAIVGD